MTQPSYPVDNGKIACPQCGGEVLPITYGLPTKRDLEDPTFYSGGCIVSEEQPNWACLSCEIEFE